MLFVYVILVSNVCFKKYSWDNLLMFLSEAKPLEVWVDQQIILSLWVCMVIFNTWCFTFVCCHWMHEYKNPTSRRWFLSMPTFYKCDFSDRVH